MRLGIFVGSFNPVHNGHVKVINYLLDNDLVDKVIVLPTPNYWEKQNLVDLKYRVEMLKIFERENIIIDEENSKYPYTYQVINNIKKENKKDEIYLVIGSDNLERLHLWKNINLILENKIIVLKRGNTDINKYLEKFDINKFIVIDDFDYIDVCSTNIRNGIYENVDDRVIEYIKKNNLYERK
jgi:nicotinate-nucleotide adenylyltransferase